MGVIFTNGFGVGTVPNNTSSWITVNNSQGGSVSNTGSTIFDIIGPNSNGGNGWVYIKKQFQTSGILYVRYDWINNDTDGGGNDWPIFEVTSTEPTDLLTTWESHRLNNSYGQIPDPVNDFGGWAIEYNAGDWIAIGVYSSDSCCGYGELSLKINESLFWNRNYTSLGIDLYPISLNSNSYSNLSKSQYYKSSIIDNQPGVYTTLANQSVSVGQKRMITYGLDFDDETSDPNYFLGFGTTSTNLNVFLGANDNSVGIANSGAVYYGGTTIFTNLPTFGTVGDIIDVAIIGDTTMWYRVNGGDWNGDSAADPTTNTGGLNINNLFGLAVLYPAVSLYGGSGPSIFSVYDSSIYGLPTDFTQIAGDRPGATFTITSDMFNGGGWANSVCNSQQGLWSDGLTGFTVSQSSNLYCGVNAQLTNYASVLLAFTVVGGTLDWHGYVCSVTWGDGSTIQNGYAKVAYEQGNHGIYIEPIDITDTDYLISDGIANNSTSLAGTFNFPATFTILSPLIDKGGWC